MQLNAPTGSNAPANPGLPNRVGAGIIAATGVAAASLVVVETSVLFVGVVFRYALHSPLTWSDELASALFLWLGMLGAVIASARQQHMAMNAVVARLGTVWKARFSRICFALEAMLLIYSVPAAIDYARDAVIVPFAALAVSTAWRAAALPIGFILMTAVALSRLDRSWQWLAVLLACSAAIAANGFDYLPPLAALGKLNLVLFFVLGVAAAVFSGLPIGFAFGLATFAYLGLATDVPAAVAIGRVDEGMSHIILLAVPLFVLLGLLMEMTGMARAMIAFLASLFGHVRGGLSYVLVGAMYLVSGISGSKAADMAAVAPALFPEMRARGAHPGDLAALLSATGAQTETVPPSIVLITIGAVTGLSIGDLFTGGLLPSALLAFVLCAVVWGRHRGQDLSHVPRADAVTKWRAFAFALPALLLPFVIRGAVMEGVATATEVSSIGIVYTVGAGLLLYGFDVRRLGGILIATAALSGAILLIVGFATGMAWALTQSNFSGDLASMMKSLPGGRAGFLAGSIVLFIVLGSVLEGIPAVVLLGPLLFPIAKSLGVHEVHYAIVVVLAMGVGLFTPPFGIGYYTACAIGRVDPNEGLRHILGYMVALVIGLILIAAVPAITIGLL